MLLNIFHCFAFVLHFCNFLHFHYACSLAVLYYSKFSRYFYFLLENLIVALISALNCVKWEWAKLCFRISITYVVIIGGVSWVIHSTTLEQTTHTTIDLARINNLVL